MFGNQYYGQQQQSRYQPMGMMNQPTQLQPYIPPVPQPTTQIGILGKVVDSIDVVKAMDIPLDGSISYFPLTDGSAIVTKQLQNDGTSKTIIYQPIKEEAKPTPVYVTLEDVKREIANIDLSEMEDFKEELREIRKELKTMKKSKED